MTSALSKSIVRYLLIWCSSVGFLLAIVSLAMPGSLGLGDLLATEVAASPFRQESPLSPLLTVTSTLSGTVDVVPLETTSVTLPSTTTAVENTTDEPAANDVLPTTTADVATIDSSLTWGEMLVSGRISVALVGALLFGLLLTIGVVLARE